MCFDVVDGTCGGTDKKVVQTVFIATHECYANCKVKDWISVVENVQINALLMKPEV